MGMKDIGENLFVLDAIRAKHMTATEYNARANGVLQTGSQIDLADYNYPKEILIVVSVGAVASGGTLLVHVESGDVTAITNTDYAFALISAVAATTVKVVTYHYIPTRRFINVEATVGGGGTVDFGITLVMGALGWGSSGQA